MGKENELIIREKELARAYDKKMAARERTIRETAESYQVPPEPGDYAARNLHRLFEMRFRESFAEKKYDKPSEFFLAEMPWIFGLVVYERYKEPFLCMVDRIRDYPYSVGWSRRSFRSGDYLSYQGRIWSILQHFSGESVINADVKDILAGDFGSANRCAIVSLNIRDYDSGEVSDVLSEEYGIATRPGAHCAPLMHRALGTVEQGAVRFSFPITIQKKKL